MASRKRSTSRIRPNRWVISVGIEGVFAFQQQGHDTRFSVFQRSCWEAADRNRRATTLGSAASSFFHTGGSARYHVTHWQGPWLLSAGAVYGVCTSCTPNCRIWQREICQMPGQSGSCATQAETRIDDMKEAAVIGPKLGGSSK